MGDIAKNFYRKEFSCKCGCGFDNVSQNVVDVVQDVRNKFGVLIIDSACRCAKHNKAVGGAPRSQHLLGTACDIRAKFASSDDVADYLESKYPDRYGIGRYRRFTHIDVRITKARWDNR